MTLGKVVQLDRQNASGLPLLCTHGAQENKIALGLAGDFQLGFGSIPLHWNIVDEEGNLLPLGDSDVVVKVDEGDLVGIVTNSCHVILLCRNRVCPESEI